MAAPNRRVDSISKRKPPLRLVPGEHEVPDLPGRPLKPTRERWAAFWGSPLANVIESDTDLAALYRLFSLYDDRERAHREYRKKPMVVGSTGQPRVNPMWSVVKDCDTEIRQLEDRFGMNARGRLNLGLMFAETAKSLDEINARYLDE